MTTDDSPPSASVDIRGLTALGDGYGHLPDGVELRVDGALEGEQVTYLLTRRARQGIAYARVEQVVKSSRARREAPCRHQGRCTGCPLMIADERGQRRMLRQMLREQYGLEVEAIVSRPGGDLGYRWSSKRVAGGAPGRLRLGSYRRGTHDVACMDECLVDHPSIVRCAREVQKVGSELRIEPYDAQRGEGDLRYVWMKANHRGQVLLTLITAGEQSRAAEELATRLRVPVGVAWSVQPDASDNMRGSEAVVLAGRGDLPVEIAGQRILVGPLGFLQPNPQAAELCYRDLCADPESGEPLRGALALDLYAGAGITTALLGGHFDLVHACDEDPESAATLGVTPEPAATFLARHAGTKPDLIVANPPRKGLGDEVCALLVALGAPRLHIMSCSGKSLARDLAALPGYSVRRLRAYDTLPQTPHLELVACLERDGEPPG